MYLPPEVLNRSFLRSVIRRKPSASSSPMSPVCSQPSSVERLGGRLGQVVVAVHHAGALDQDLAVLGDLDLGAGERPGRRVPNL